MAADSVWIAERAKALGFDLCGVVRAEKFPELRQFEDWLERGYAGEMKYLEDPRRRNPSLVMRGLRSVIVCALNYNTAHPYSTEKAASAAAKAGSPHGWISRYAWGDDYHDVMWQKLNMLAAALKEEFPEPFVARAFADTGPVAERVFAQQAGLGWLGKNTLLLNETLGSWLFLGVILTTLDIAPLPSEAPPPDLCGNCRQCLDACPTSALVEPYVLDARRCISYLTIELRGNIPEEFRKPMGWQVFGCDICQDVCPYNRSALASSLPEFQPRGKSSEDSLLMPSLEWLAGMSEEEFREFFRGSAVKRTKWAGLVRNACVALGNSRVSSGSAEYVRVVALLKRLGEARISAVAESARWALSRIQQESS
ncbi:MAG: tRNA epoxyqueuosine(34) reductase QueG [Candidatus Acidiferrum sp.]